MDLEYRILIKVIQSEKKNLHVLPHMWILTYNIYVYLHIYVHVGTA